MFSVHAPFLWNSLPLLVRALAAVPNPASVACFKTALKTHLYVSSVPLKESSQVLRQGNRRKGWSAGEVGVGSGGADSRINVQRVNRVNRRPSMMFRIKRHQLNSLPGI